MSLQTVFDNFALLAEAPNGADKLRGLILHLAVRGKLATQKPSDASASTLVAAIKKERAKKLGSLKGKNRSELQVISGGEKFCSVPTQWAWIRLNELGRFTGGATPSTNNPQYWGGDVFWVSPKDMKNGSVYGSELKITEKALNETRLELIPPKSILIVGRSGILRRLLPVAINEVQCTVNQDLKVIIPFIDGISEYVQLMLKGFEKFILTDLVKGGMTVQSLKYSEFEQQAFPFPPLEEQRRIVTKVEELMRLCEELAARQQARRESRVCLNNVTLAPLNNATSLTLEEFDQATARLADNFETLYDFTGCVSSLRATILQLAVQGKLVPQDPNDQPAKELLKQIQSEIAEQETAGVYKNSKQLPPIAKTEQPFPLPFGWKWSRLRSLVFTLGDGLHGTPEYSEGTNCYFINGNNFVDGQIVIKPHTKTVSLAEMEKHKKPMTSNTVLVSINGTLGSVAFYNNENIVLGKSACYFNLASLIDKHFVRRVIESPYFVNYAIENATGTTIRNLGLKAMNHFPVPLPPLEEQKRIVAKVDHLMGICDELESKLRRAEANSEKLINAAVHYVLSSTFGPRPHTKLGVRP